MNPAILIVAISPAGILLDGSIHVALGSIHISLAFFQLA